MVIKPVEILLGTSANVYPFSVELDIARKHKTYLYGGKPKTVTQIKQIMTTAFSVVVGDLEAWNLEDWPTVYARWAANASTFYVYPCATEEHQYLDEPLNSPTGWDEAQKLLDDLALKYPKAFPLVTGVLPIPLGKKALRGAKAISLDFNILAIVEAIAKKSGKTVRDILKTQGYDVPVIGGYLTRETGWSDCTWFDYAAKTYGVPTAKRPPDFRNPAAILPWLRSIEIFLLQYYEATHLLNASGNPSSELKILWGGNLG